MSAQILLFISVVTAAEFPVDGQSGSFTCPNNCSDDGVFLSALTVDCHRCPDIQAEQLTEQLDSLLSSILTYGRLTSLSIVNSPLTHVPRSVCRLTTLTQLHLDNNQLTELPHNCFTNLTRLENFSAAYNYIEAVQDGLFDGLVHLRSLELSNNRIRSIGLSVFAAPANLPLLRYIDLSHNNLSSLEPWAYDRGIQGNPNSTVIVNLEHNHIRRFTNRMGFEGNCRRGVPRIHLLLNSNQIRHYIDMARNWNMTVESFSQCIAVNTNLYGPNTIHTWMYMHDNKITCDCIDYHFYRALSHQDYQAIWQYFFCDYYDPASKQWKDANKFRLPEEKFICEMSELCPPKCRCVFRPANATLHVYCSNAKLSVLPHDLPTLPNADTKYKLDFSRNSQLSGLPGRPYFKDTFALDVSRCLIDYVDEQEWKHLLQLPELNLNGNRIKLMPKSVASMNISTKRLSIGSNPWDCSCSNEWMAGWFASISNRLVDKKVYCNSPHRQKGKDMLLIPKEELCVDPTAEAVKRAMIITLSSVVCAVVILLSVGVIVYRLRIRLYTRWKFHPFDRDECLGEDMDYDVFLCCSSEDHQRHGMRVMNLIESKGYRVCYHLRDFLGGGAIADNICAAVQRSRRTVCLLTDNFLQSGYCMEEFNISYHRNVLEKGTKRLIVLMALLNRVDFYADDSPRTLSLRQYLRQYTYIDYTADDWLDKLLYALPLRGMNTYNCNRL